MLKLTIAKKINIFTISLALIGIIGSTFSVIASVSGIRHAESLDNVYLSANLLVTNIKTNILNIGADVDRYISTHNESYITDIDNSSKAPYVEDLGKLLQDYSKELKAYHTMYNTLNEVEEATGISFSESSDIIDTYSTVILGASGDYPFISLIVLSDIGDLTIRKAEGSGDLSGVYIEYEEEWVENKNGLRLNFKGNTKEDVSIVWWETGKYSISIFVENDTGISKDVFMDFFEKFF